MIRLQPFLLVNLVGLVASVWLSSSTLIRAETDLQAFAIPTFSSWTNSLKMEFVVGLAPGLKVCVWETRVRDFREYTKSKYLPKKESEFEQTDDHPVVSVSWNEAKAFCLWLTERERRYGLIPSSASYRLPTDREWTWFMGRFTEPKALPRDLDENANGGYVWGLEWPPSKNVGNFGVDMDVDSFEFTSPVGSFAASPVGLFDVAGNAWEWCEDWYSNNQIYRVLRGGSWRGETYRNNLATERHAHLPRATVDCYGFRCVLVDLESDSSR
jgi:formylglycine-generating enzyme required for sulfatase activity